MATKWNEFRQTLNLTPAEEDIINLEKALISAVVEAREQSGRKERILPLRRATHGKGAPSAEARVP